MTDTRPEDDASQEVDAVDTRSADPFGSDRILYGEQSAHLAFQQQLADLLDQADITDEQRQEFLIAATCPCCGAGGLSLSLKLKTDSTPGF